MLSRTESESKSKSKSKSKSTEPPPENVLWATSLTGAIDTLRSKGGVHEIFVIGGGEIYSQAMGVPGLVSRCFVTEVDEGKFATKDGKTVEFDTFFDHDLSGNGSGSGSGGWEKCATFAEEHSAEGGEEKGYEFCLYKAKAKANAEVVEEVNTEVSERSVREQSPGSNRCSWGN